MPPACFHAPVTFHLMRFAFADARFESPCGFYQNSPEIRGCFGKRRGWDSRLTSVLPYSLAFAPCMPAARTQFFAISAANAPPEPLLNAETLSGSNLILSVKAKRHLFRCPFALTERMGFEPMWLAPNGFQVPYSWWILVEVIRI